MRGSMNMQMSPASTHSLTPRSTGWLDDHTLIFQCYKQTSNRTNVQSDQSNNPNVQSDLVRNNVLKTLA